MRTSDFDYHLPPEMIAQRPADPRDTSRLLIMDRASGTLRHRIFRDLPRLISPGDVLVLNETRVIPARLRAKKIPTGGSVEILLLKQLSSQTWETLVGGKGLKPGRRLSFREGLEGEIIKNIGGARRIVHFNKPILSSLDNIGETPLPPYIHTPLQRSDEYQTVFAHYPGSIAAPTAGLHFTTQLLTDIEKHRTYVEKITLHVGLDTFAPVTEDDPEGHLIHSEWCQVSDKTAKTINARASAGYQIIAVGTTTVRTLETAALLASHKKRVTAFEGPTNLYILPGFNFRAVDVMLTNFHLPRSTLLMMVCAFAGRENVLNAYRVAIEQGYRFYSFGDAMLIL